jgi:hypothetical protein
VVYLTAFADKEELISLLQSYGFAQTKRMRDGELMFEKVMQYGPLHPGDQADILDFDRKVYPRFYDGRSVIKYCVPIKGEYHKKLFSEISYLKPLPLFLNQASTFDLMVSPDHERKPGNTIRKVYLCRAQAKYLKPGDLLFFICPKTEGWQHLNALQQLVSSSE